MTDKPILFSAPMVRALLEGRKTQDRRVLKPQPPEAPICERPEFFTSIKIDRNGEMLPGKQVWGVYGEVWGRKITYAPGDRLWVRETWACMPMTAYDLPKTKDQNSPGDAVYYRADWNRSGKPNWKSSIHMQSWASRLTLIVTDVRVQRLQDISRGDAVAEGYPFPDVKDGPCTQPVEWFHDLWNAINGPGAWDENPWVCALTFTVHKCNIDAMEGRRHD